MGKLKKILELWVVMFVGMSYGAGHVLSGDRDWLYDWGTFLSSNTYYSVYFFLGGITLASWVANWHPRREQ